MKVYLDTTALSNLWRCVVVDERLRLRARRRLCSPLFAGRPTLILGPTIITEMAPISNTSLVRDELEFIRSLPDAQFLRSVPERIAAEVALTHGQVASVFLDSAMQEALLTGATRMEPMWRAEQEQMARLQRIFVDKEADTRKRLDLMGDRRSRATSLRSWFSDPRQLVAHAAISFMRRNRAALALSRDERRWPQPEDLPTVWGIFSYDLARAFLFHRDGRRLDGNDLQDWTHYAASMHADVLVTDDSKFTQIVEHCPAPKPSLLRFEQWIAMIT